MNIDNLNMIVQMGIAGWSGFMLGYIKGVFDVGKVYKRKVVRKDKTGAIIMRAGDDGVYKAK